MLIRGWEKLSAEIAFRKHQRDLKKQHLAAAKEKYPVEKYAIALEELEARIESEATKEFQDIIGRVTKQLEKAEGRMLRREIDLQLLQRNFKSEMKPIYDRLGSIKSALGETYDRKTKAHEALNSAKSSLDEWYSKSERSFFGNRGKPLPRRAIFGQSTSDRDFHKSQRDAAGNDIQSCKHEIHSLKSERNDLSRQLAGLKDHRSRMKALRDRGLTAKKASTELREAADLVTRLRNQAEGLAKQQRTFRHKLKVNYRFIEKVAALEKQKTAKKSLIAAFDSGFAKKRRRIIFERERAKG